VFVLVCAPSFEVLIELTNVQGTEDERCDIRGQSNALPLDCYNR
jgi:hypothetical protein